MIKKLKLAFASLVMIAGLAVGFTALAPAASALDCSTPPPGGQQGTPTCMAQGGVNDSGGGGQKLEPYIQKVINIMLFIIGIIAVIVIVIAGIQYTTSSGNAEQASKAKNAIIYAVVGIVIAVMAYAIVGFVIGNI